MRECTQELTGLKCESTGKVRRNREQDVKIRVKGSEEPATDTVIFYENSTLILGLLPLQSRGLGAGVDERNFTQGEIPTERRMLISL